MFTYVTIFHLYCFWLSSYNFNKHTYLLIAGQPHPTSYLLVGSLKICCKGLFAVTLID